MIDTLKAKQGAAGMMDRREANLRCLVDGMNLMDGRRRSIGLTLTELAFKSGVSTNSYCAYRREARDPTLANLVALADTVGCEIILRRKSS